MQSFKNKLYNYEAPPPEEIWQHIAEEMQDKKQLIFQLIKNLNLFFILQLPPLLW